MSARAMVARFLARWRFRAAPALAAHSLRFGGTVAGTIDGCRDGLVTGWIYDASRPDAVLSLEVLLNGRAVAEGRADVSRPDIGRLAGDGGRHGFAIAVDELALPIMEGQVLAVRLADGKDEITRPCRVAPSWGLHLSTFAGVGRFTDLRHSDEAERGIFSSLVERELSSRGVEKPD